MKTTVEIADLSMKQPRRIAAGDGETLRTRIENGPAKKPASRQAKAKPFKLRRVTMGGKGLQHEVAQLSMHDIILMSYEGRSPLVG